MTNGQRVRTPARTVAIWGAVAIVAYAVLGAVQILVLNPLAAAPGASLGEIHAEMAAANESLAAPWVLAWMGIGAALGLAILLLALQTRVSRAGISALALAVLVLGAPGYWVASFPAGMSLADTFATNGGDHAPWALILYAVSAASLLGLVVLGVLGARART